MAVFGGSGGSATFFSVFPVDTFNSKNLQKKKNWSLSSKYQWSVSISVWQFQAYFALDLSI